MRSNEKFPDQSAWQYRRGGDLSYDSTMKILVTGAAGFIGSHTCERLLAAGHWVDGVDNFRSGHSRNLANATLSPNFCFHHVDLTDPSKTERLFARTKPEAIIHLAALVSVPESIEKPALNRLLNVEMTRIVADAAQRHKVSRIVFSSSAAVYGEPAMLPLPESAEKRPMSPYGDAKLESEEILMRWAANTNSTAICLRYFNVYGPRQDPESPYSGVISLFTKRCATGHPVAIFGTGRQTRDFVYVTDVALANQMSATQRKLNTAVINICTGRSSSLLQLLDILRIHHPDAPPAQYLPPRNGDILHSYGTFERAAEMLGFVASVELKDGLLFLLKSSETSSLQ
jgi:UDP-glucose 4-epimerase